MLDGRSTCYKKHNQERIVLIIISVQNHLQVGLFPDLSDHLRLGILSLEIETHVYI